MRVTGNKCLSFTLPDDEWRTISCADHHVVVSKQNAEPPRTTQSTERGLDRFERCCTLLKLECHHLHEHFRIGLTDAFNAPRRKCSAKLLEILNDAIMNKVNGTVVGSVGMGVNLGHAAVGGPASVSDAECTLNFIRQPVLSGSLSSLILILLQIKRMQMSLRHKIFCNLKQFLEKYAIKY